MNIDELGLKVWRGQEEMGDPRTGNQVITDFSRALIAEYEKTTGSEPFCYLIDDEGYEQSHKEYPGAFPVFLRPDPRVAELEAEVERLKSQIAIHQRGLQQSEKTLLAKIAELEAQSEERRQTILDLCERGMDFKDRVKELEAHNAALLMAIQKKDTAMNRVLTNGPGAWVPIELCNAITLSPSAELLEARDRKRDAKLIHQINGSIYSLDTNNILFDLAKRRESGEWKPEL